MPSSLSWWQQRLTSADAVAPAAPTELLHQHHWDYIVIGSGLAGVSTAFFLAKNQQTQAQQASILVLERRSGVASGATGRNGGHLWPKPHDHGVRRPTRTTTSTARWDRCTCQPFTGILNPLWTGRCRTHWLRTLRSAELRRCWLG
eukprot:scaffold1637_cov410-Prasinococcus_capsulatus_cf.AAC.25